LKQILSAEAVLQHEPGTGFYYSNTGFHVLELLIEEVTGRDFAEYMKNEVLLPLGMRDSSFQWSTSFDPPVPNGYDGKGNPIPVYVYPAKASGGLFSTVEDIAAFAAAGMSGLYDTNTMPSHQVLSNKSIETIHTPMTELSGYYRIVFDSYGLGHFIEALPNGMKAVSHGGQGSGWMTHFHLVPETGDGIVILSNSQRSWPFFAYILRQWARWNGFSSIGFGRIIQTGSVLWIVIGVLIFYILQQLWGVGEGLFLRQRRFVLCIKKKQSMQVDDESRNGLIRKVSVVSENSRAHEYAPSLKRLRIQRSFQIGVSLLIGAVLLWVITRDYFFLSSVFPIASVWLGAALLCTALVLLISALSRV
jgi:hypothetical protein